MFSISRSTKCEYLDGSCLASPRWVSLLVAEIYYPDATFPNPSPNQNRNPVQGASPPGPGVSINNSFSEISTLNSLLRIMICLLLVCHFVMSQSKTKLLHRILFFVIWCNLMSLLCMKAKNLLSEQNARDLDIGFFHFTHLWNCLQGNHAICRNIKLQSTIWESYIARFIFEYKTY